MTEPVTNELSLPATVGHLLVAVVFWAVVYSAAVTPVTRFGTTWQWRVCAAFASAFVVSSRVGYFTYPRPVPTCVGAVIALIVWVIPSALSTLTIRRMSVSSDPPALFTRFLVGVGVFVLSFPLGAVLAFVIDRWAVSLR